MSLHSGKRINRYAWTELPMPNKVIEQMHRLATTVEVYDGIIFTDMEGNVLEDQIDDNASSGQYEEEEVCDDSMVIHD